MRAVFVDTQYLVAHINPRDQWNARAREVEAQLGSVELVTTESVLMETLNFLAEYKPSIRQSAVNLAYQLLGGFDIELISHTRETLLDGLELYEARLDKGYSLTDCISMNVMRERGIAEVLTHDHHFEQEGFVVLL